MDDRSKGTAKHVRGSIKEAIGILIGDLRVEAEGASEKAAGRAQHTAAVRAAETDRNDRPQ